MDGQKLIISCAGIYAHLQKLWNFKSTGSVVLRYLMVDIDAHRTTQKWKNEDGSIDYHKVHNHLSTKLPKIAIQLNILQDLTEEKESI